MAKFVSKIKRLVIVLEPSTPALYEGGRLVRPETKGFKIRFEQVGEHGEFDTSNPQYSWNREPKGNVQKKHFEQMEENVIKAIKKSVHFTKGVVREWTKPKMYKMVEVQEGEEQKSDEEKVVVLHQDAQLPTDTIMSEEKVKEVIKEVK